MEKEIVPNVFVPILNRFNKLIDSAPSVEKVKTELLTLKADAINATKDALTSRQTAAIVDRVNYYLKGEYGKSKK